MKRIFFPWLSGIILSFSGISHAQPSFFTRQLQHLPPQKQADILWLARCIFSETSSPYEQELVAWVVRNRVETRYRGSTYREVILDPYQFSAFNHSSPMRNPLLQLQFSSPDPAWQQALRIAYKVYFAPASLRPFPKTTRHFYSPISRPNPPAWARGKHPLYLAGIDPSRFLFFDKVDEPVSYPLARQSAPSALYHVLHRHR